MTRDIAEEGGGEYIGQMRKERRSKGKDK